MIKSILQLLAGNGTAQLIQFISIPLLTIYYSPQDFGQLALAIAISGILAVISSLQLHVGLVSLQSKSAVNRLLSSGVLLNLVMTLSSLILILLVDLFVYDSELSISFIFIVILITFFSSINNLLKSVFVYRGTFFELSKTLIIRALTIVVLQFYFAWQSIENGLVIGLLLGEIVLFGFIGLYKIKIQNIKSIFTSHSLKYLSFFIKKLKAFVLYGTPQELVSVAIFWMPLIIISSIFGDNLGGQYSISARILWPATILVTGSVAQVLYHRMLNVSKVDIVNEIYFHFSIKLLFIPLAILAYYLTPIIFSLLLNDTWVEAKVLSKYVILLCVMFVYILPYRVVYRVLKIQKSLLAIELLFLILLIFIGTQVQFVDIEYLLKVIIFIAFIQVLCTEVSCRKYMKLK